MNLPIFPVLAAFVFLSVATVALAVSPDPVTPVGETAEHSLRYQFESGEIVRYAIAHAANIRTTIEGTTQAAKTKSDSTKAWKILDVLPNGEIEFAHVVENIRMQNELPGRAIAEYDSEKDATPPAGFEHAAAAVGVTLTVVRMMPDGEIVSREEKHAQPGNAEDAPMAVPLPKEPVAVGFEWNEQHFVNVLLQDEERRRVETRRHFKLTGVQNGIATIAISYQVLSPIDARTESQLVQRLADGKIRFDIDRGRIVSQQLDVDKRIVGFAGPTSSMHYRSRFTEKLLEEAQEVAKADEPPLK